MNADGGVGRASSRSSITLPMGRMQHRGPCTTDFLVDFLVRRFLRNSSTTDEDVRRTGLVGTGGSKGNREVFSVISVLSCSKRHLNNVMQRNCFSTAPDGLLSNHRPKPSTARLPRYYSPSPRRGRGERGEGEQRDRLWYCIRRETVDRRQCFDLHSLAMDASCSEIDPFSFNSVTAFLPFTPSSRSCCSLRRSSPPSPGDGASRQVERGVHHGRR